MPQLFWSRSVAIAARAESNVRRASDLRFDSLTGLLWGIEGRYRKKGALSRGRRDSLPWAGRVTASSPHPSRLYRVDNDAELAELVRRGRAAQAEERQIEESRLLRDVEHFLARFVAYPSEHARLAHVLWIVHTHCMGAWESTPRIAFLSPEPASGKTRALEVSELLVPRAVEAVNATPAYLFRKVSDPDGLPTILFDEIDTLFGPKAKDNEGIRGMLNAGHRRGAVAGRCAVKGKTLVTEELPAFAAVALAGLGDLPDTILTRCVIVRMRRRASTETIESFRRRFHVREGTTLRLRLEAWATMHIDELERAQPDMPVGIADRAADVWEPLLAVADLVGGEWPSRARVAAVTLVTDAKAASPSLGVRLLTDLRSVFGDRDSLFTTTILESLIGIEDSPWGDLKGKPLDSRRLASLLRQYDVTSTTVRVGGAPGKGYRRVDLHDAWLRYVGPATKGAVTSVTSGKVPPAGH